MAKQTTEFEENMKESTEKEGEGLPPRSEVHKDKKKSKFKIKHFFIRILTLLFILLPIGILWYTERYIEGKKAESSANSEKSAFEVIFFDSKKKNNESNSSAKTFQFHTVKEGETLENIAKKYFPNEDGIAIIKKYNEVPEELEPGQVLKIPKKPEPEQKK